MLKGGQDHDRSSCAGPLLSLHYKLLLAVFSISAKESLTNSSFKHNIFRGERTKQPSEQTNCSDCSSLFADIIKHCATYRGINFTTPKKDGSSSSAHSKPTEALIENFIQLLNDCLDASISCHILDLLSILFFNMEWSRGDLAKVTQGTLHSVYTTSAGNIHHLPYALVKVNSILTEGSSDKEGNHDRARVSLMNEAFTNLIETSNGNLKAKDSFTATFVHHILAHWSVLILDGTSQTHFLTELLESLDVFLTRRSTQHINSSPIKRQALSGLNEKSYACLFELLLYMTNASLSLSHPRRVKKKRASCDYLADKGAYGEIIGLVDFYTKLLSIFQINRICFPSRFIRTLVKNSSLLIRLSDYKLRQCVQWRNSQPSQIGMGMDCAAVELLQPLVDSVAACCIGSIISFCDRMKVQQDGRISSFASSYKHTRAITGLLYRAEGITETLRGICQSQNLIFPKDFTSTHDTSIINQSSDVNYPATKKRKRMQNEVSLKRMVRSRDPMNKMLTSPSILEVLPESDLTMQMLNDSINRKSTIQSGSEDSEQNDSDSEVDDDSIRVSVDNADDDDDDDSFGVIGNWAN